jgi:Alr-MurF fusion protein
LILSIRNIIPVINAQFLGNSISGVIDHVSIDSRSLQNGNGTLFFAIDGINHDGHDYIPSLIANGVCYFVVEKLPAELDPNANFLVVKDTIDALQRLAAYHRGLFDFPIIGITGSNGKTIIKEWLNFLLSPDYNIIRSPKSYNSQIGVPLSVLGINENNNLGIFEAGISTINEMDNLQRIIKPTIGVLSNIGSAHDEGFLDAGQKIKEKLKLFSDVSVLILNKNKTIEAFLNPKIKTFTWSSDDGKADVFVIAKEIAEATELKITFRELSISITIPFQDQASVENAIQCLMVLLYFEYSQETIQERMQLLYPVEMRLKVKNGINTTTIIDDSYSSDFQSLKIALDFLENQRQHKKKTLILSDIFQSGLITEELYSKVSQLVISNKIHRVIAIGKTISEYKNKFPNCVAFNTTKDFVGAFETISFENESILIKGARHFHFEEIVSLLEEKTHETVLEINLNGDGKSIWVWKRRIRNCQIAFASQSRLPWCRFRG